MSELPPKTFADKSTQTNGQQDEAAHPSFDAQDQLISECDCPSTDRYCYYNRARRALEQMQQMQERDEDNSPRPPSKNLTDHVTVCVQTIRSHLRALTLGSLPTLAESRMRTVELSEADKVARMRFAQLYQNFDWANVVFSGQKSFYLTRSGNVRVAPWQNNTRYVNNRLRHNNGNMHLWAWMSGAGLGELAQLPPQANASNYLNVLEEILLPTVRVVYPVEEIPNISLVHQDDEGNTDIGINTRDWFEQHSDIVLIPWPDNSADINPMEKLMGLLTLTWNSGERTRQALQDHVHDVWEFMRGTDICAALINAIKPQLRAILHTNGVFNLYEPTPQ